MTRRAPRKVSEFKEKRREKGGLEIEMENGVVFFLEPPELWPDMPRYPSDDDVARAALGDRYDEFVDAGGTGRLANALLMERHEVDIPESSASADSSTSTSKK